MRFSPKTEEECSRNKLLEPGEGDFEVKSAEDKTSKAGNDMIELVVQVWDFKGESTSVFDYLLESIPHKLRHFCYAAGIGRAYEGGNVTAELCVGKTGRCVLRLGQDREKKYPPKTEIADYVVADRTKETKGYQQGKRQPATVGAEVIPESGGPEDDGIPF